LTIEARFDRRAQGAPSERHCALKYRRVRNAFAGKGPAHRAIEHWMLVEPVPNPKNHRRHSDAQIAGYRWQYHGLWFRLPADRSKSTSSPGMAGNRPLKTGVETATAIVPDHFNEIEKRANRGQLSHRF
jgi:hypothetical protein